MDNQQSAKMILFYRENRSNQRRISTLSFYQVHKPPSICPVFMGTEGNQTARLSLITKRQFPSFQLEQPPPNLKIQTYLPSLWFSISVVLDIVDLLIYAPSYPCLCATSIYLALEILHCLASPTSSSLFAGFSCLDQIPSLFLLSCRSELLKL